jgi:hypothetical protein
MEAIQKREAWNKGKLVGQKPPLKPKDIWAIRIYLQNADAARDLAMFNLAIDSKLRGCDLVGLRVRDAVEAEAPRLQRLGRGIFADACLQRSIGRLILESLMTRCCLPRTALARSHPPQCAPPPQLEASLWPRDWD